MQNDAQMMDTVRALGRIADAIKAGDGDEARLAMKAVITEGFSRAAGRMAEPASIS